MVFNFTSSQSLLFPVWQCSEGFMHTRMRRRVETLIQALDRAKSDAEKLKKLVNGGSFKRLSLNNDGN